MTQTNATRAQRCQAALAAYANDAIESNLIDLLADAMHWCDRYGSDFHIALAQACRHYIHELNDQQTDKRRL